MPKKSTLFFCFVLLLSNLSAIAQTSYSSQIISPQENGYLCGGKTLMARVYKTITNENEISELITFNEANEFFLEFVDSKDNVLRQIKASKVYYTNAITPVFVLPDSMKNGSSYRIRILATDPEIRTNSSEITFGAGKIPFSVNFSQNLEVIGKQPYINYVPLDITYEGDGKKLYPYFSSGEFNYKIKLSNGQSFETFNSKPSLSLVLKDSITTFKIVEIKNSCGLAGSVKGETKVVWKQNLKKLFIESNNKYQSVCDGSNLILKVFGAEPKINQKVIVEIGKNYDFDESRLLFINEAELINGVLNIDISRRLSNKNYYTVRIKSLDGSQISNSLEFYVYRKNVGIGLSYGFNESGNLRLWFDQRSVTGQSEYSGGLTYVEINNVDVTNLMGGSWNTIQIPTPKKDTTFKITKAINGCGTMNEGLNSVTFNPQISRFLEIIPEKENVCEGETVSFKLNDSDEAFLNEIDKRAYIYVWGRGYNNQTNSYNGNSVYKNYYLERGSYNRQTKTVTFKVPNNISKDFYDTFGNQKYTIEYGRIYHDYLYKGRFVSTNYPDTRIYFTPVVSLTQKQMTIDGSGIVKLPIKYIGSDSTKVSINNLPFTIINSKIVPSNCIGCGDNNGLETEIRVFAEKSTIFRITNVENACSVGIGIGETSVIVNQKPSLVIDDSLNDKEICLNSKGEKSKLLIKFEKRGNWTDVSKELTGRIVYKFLNSSDISNAILFSSESEFAFDVENYFNLHKIEITIFSQNGITSQTITMYPTEKPSYYNLYSSSAEITYENNIYTYYYQPNNSPFGIEAYTNKLQALINNKSYNFETSNGNYYSYFGISTNSLRNDTTFVLNKLYNVCGSVEINRKIRLIKKNVVISGAWDDTYNSEIQSTSCAGTKRFIKYYYGNYVPSKDSVIVQLARRKNNTNEYTYDFFDVPTQKYSLNKIVYTIPDTCTGVYYWRLRSYDNTMVTKVVSLANFYEKPNVKLTSSDGKNEILPDQPAILKISSNIEKNGYFLMKMNNGELLSNYSFGHYINEVVNDTTKQLTYKLINRGLGVSPKVNTEYKIEQVFNQCGVGKAEGVVSVKVHPTIELNLTDIWYKRDFCVNDSVALNLTYNGSIPKDTLFGVYLNNYFDSKFSAELATFKPNSTQIKVKIPNNLVSGYYGIQVRKVSRKSKFVRLNDSILQNDSLKIAESRRELDSNVELLEISTPPNVELSGNSEIFVGESATINVYARNLNNQNSLVSKDTIRYNWVMPYYYTFTDGSKFTGRGNMGINVTPNKSTNYVLSSVQNACGVGKVSGAAYVKVLPKTEQRIEFLGFLRKYSGQNYTDYYNPSTQICQGQEDSLDVKVFGLSSIDLKKVQTLISDKNGINFTKLTLTGSKTIDTFGGIKLRTFFKIPENLPSGFEYKFKTIIDDEVLNSNTSTGNSFIYELPTASIMEATKQFVVGEKVEGLVKFTGDAPWYLTIKDDNDVLVFNNLPTKNDTLNKFKDFKFKPIYLPEFKVDFLPDKSKVYKVSAVYNTVCGVGKVGNETLKVELVLASELENSITVLVFPNPTLENLNLKLDNLQEDTDVELYSSNGSKLLHLKFNKAELMNDNFISMKQFASGNYYLKISNKEMARTFRISKQ